MRRKTILSLVLAALCILTACSSGYSAAETKEDSSSPSDWKDYYDLGVRYLSEGNYQEAIIAFTAAIEIDPKAAEAYVGRGNAYFALEGTPENLLAAQSDFETAIELDRAQPEAYLGLANVLIQQGNYDEALEVLKSSLDYTGDNTEILNKISELEKMSRQDTDGEAWGTENFESFSDEQKQYIEDLVSAVTQENRELTQELLLDIHIVGEDYITSFTLQGYRIQLFDYSTNQDDILGGMIEIHPSKGHGYYAAYETREDGHFSERYLIGECSNWNWEGPFEFYHRYFYPDDCDTITVQNGYMQEGLLEGEVIDTTSRVYVGSTAEIANDWEKTTYISYSKGARADSEDDERVYSATSAFLRGNESLWDWSIPQ